MKETKPINYAEMIEALEQYYESAGLRNFYEKDLKNKPESEIRALYQQTLGA